MNRTVTTGPLSLELDSTVLQDTTAAAADDTITSTDTIQADTARPPVDTVIPNVEEPIVQVKKPLREPEVAASDTLQPEATDTLAPADTTAVSADTLDTSPCSDISSDLWVYPDPSGGLHQGEVKVQFVANRSATIQYRVGKQGLWQRYEGAPILISATTVLYYDAIDSCGIVMERRDEYYEIAGSRTSAECDPSMVAVKVGSMHFCIDRYEWPNRKGETPNSFISYYQAQDSCFTAQKRLCSAEEWTIACSGPYSSRYPYGKLYERYACSTHDSTVAPSGTKRECRSFFGAYDMSGNLSEWTATKSVENSAFFYVAGGFWESGPKSGCYEKRYSYYPQNQHNPVGFRCCKDIASSGAAPGRGGK